MRSRWRVAAVVAVMGSGAGCNQVAGIREGLPIEDSPPPPDAGEPPPECAAVTDCDVKEPACRTAVGCEAGSCVYEDELDGTLLPEQTAGDCVELVCDGAGRAKVVPAASDAPNDNNICTLDACAGSTPQHTPQSAVPCYGGPAGSEGKGICVAGVQQCDATGNPVGACAGEMLPGVETCVSPLDEDCDGAVNEEGEGCVCVPGTIAPCYSGPIGTAGVGACHAGAQSCNANGLGYGPCVGHQGPMVETCDAAEVDEDCDAATNEEGIDCVCGDGYLSMGEGCEDGNLVPTDLCTATCQPAACGDGFVQAGIGEDCDDEGTSDGDRCSPGCQMQEVLDVVGGDYHTCALLSRGFVKCWGFNYYGQLGLGDDAWRGADPGEMGDTLPVVNLGTGKTAIALAGGAIHTCALLNEGSVKCWGYNEDGELGLGDNAWRGDGSGEMGDTLPAVNFGTGKTAIALAAGGYHTCALLDDGSVKCWGYNDEGRLGLGDTAYRGDDPGEMGDTLPVVNFGTGKTAIALATGEYHSCALINDGSVKCWGFNGYGQLGLGDAAHRGDDPGEMGDTLLAVNFGTGKTAITLAAGGYHSCALLNDGSVKCWGHNDYGQLGLGDTAHRGDDPGEMGDTLLAVSVGIGKTAIALAAGRYHTCALLNDGSVKCWGYNTYGQLGLGDGARRGDGPGEMGDTLLAVNMGTGKVAIALAARWDHTCALLNDGSVKCWGDNSNGQLGLGDTANRGDGPGEMGDDLPSVKLFSPFW